MRIRGGDHESAQTLQGGVSHSYLCVEVRVEFESLVRIAIVQFHQEPAVFTTNDLHYFCDSVSVFVVILGLAECEYDFGVLIKIKFVNFVNHGQDDDADGVSDVWKWRIGVEQHCFLDIIEQLQIFEAIVLGPRDHT